jgi:cell division protein FtsQ
LRRGFSLFLAASALSGMALVTHFGAARARTPAPVIAEIERWVEFAGFGLQQVTPDGDIFDALDFGRTRTLVSFDSKAARVRIESLPWIERASIERIAPDRLDITVVERTPFAVWRKAGQNYLIDRGGRTLGAVGADALPQLPRVAGEGGATEAAMLFKRLASYPELLRQVRVAERIGERRWSLELAGGSVMHLPPDHEAEALTRGASLAGMHFARPAEIDLRVAERPIVRDRRPAESAQAAGIGLALGGI